MSKWKVPAGSWPCLALALTLAVRPAPADEVETPGGASWPDTFLARVELLALLQSLNSDLLGHDSATLTLERWCGRRGLASPATVVADRVRDGETPPSNKERRELAVAPGEVVRHRRVRLRCGTTLLSEADNWYVPARLTAPMNARLDATDEPFGRVVQPLHFQRHTLSATLLWSPLPDGWESQPAPTDPAAGAIPIPVDVLRHRALLTLPDGTPFSEVIETYKAAVLGVPPPVRRPPPP